MALNKVMLLGNVGRDPEIRFYESPSTNGTTQKVASFSLATTERYRGRNNEVHENTEWHSIVAWRNAADYAEKYIRKGSLIFLEGHLRTRTWTDQAGVQHRVTEIIADNLQHLRRADNNPGSTPSAYGAISQSLAQQSRAQQASTVPETPPVPDNELPEDLPF